MSVIERDKEELFQAERVLRNIQIVFNTKGLEQSQDTKDSLSKEFYRLENKIDSLKKTIKLRSKWWVVK